MRYFYAAPAIRESDSPNVLPVPDIAGIELVRWRWIALLPFWYFETADPLAGAIPAPAAYPNGTPLNTECTQPWCEVVAGG